MSRYPPSGGVTQEPHTSDGRAYWRDPGARKSTASSTLGSLISSIRGKKPEPAPETPLELLMQRVPIEDIMLHHNYGLDHMLRDGVDIDDFLANGYRWEDLCKFEYIAKEGPLRCLETLTLGLGLTANHLRRFRDRLPIEEFRKATQISTSDFCKRLGLYFPKNGPLQCAGDLEWNAMDCVRLGLTMDDLIDFGLMRMEQYKDLMLSDLTRSEAREAEKRLGVTPEHLAQLIDVDLPFSPPQGERKEYVGEEVEEEVEVEGEEEEGERSSPPVAEEYSPDQPTRRPHKGGALTADQVDRIAAERRRIRLANAPPAPQGAVAPMTRAQERFNKHGYVKGGGSGSK